MLASICSQLWQKCPAGRMKCSHSWTYRNSDLWAVISSLPGQQGNSLLHLYFLLPWFYAKPLEFRSSCHNLDPAVQSQTAAGLGKIPTAFMLMLPDRLVGESLSVTSLSSQDGLLFWSWRAAISIVIFSNEHWAKLSQMYEGASLTVLWKIASQITRLYKAHINMGPKDIQIALASML